MGHTFELKWAAYTHFYTEIEAENRFIGLDMYKILTVFKKNCIADSMAGGQAKKGNRETRRERERKEDVSKMGCIHKHTLFHRNRG